MHSKRKGERWMFLSLTEEKRRNELKGKLEKELFEFFEGRYELVDQGMFGILLKARTQSGFLMKCKISYNFKKTGSYSASFDLPSDWADRLTISSSWDGTDLNEFLMLWESLLNESESVLQPAKEPLHPLEMRREALSGVMKDYQRLISLYREDWGSEEALAVEEKLKIHLSEDSCLEHIWRDEIKPFYHLGSLTYRWYLIGFKDRGFILSDAGNGHWYYISTVEEFLLNQHWDEDFHHRKF